MARAIDAEEFAKRLMDLWDKAEAERRNDIVSVLANYITPCLVGTPTIEPKQEWISVKDRLPEDDLPEGSKKMRIKVLVAIRNNKGVYTVRTQTRALGGSYHVSEEWEWGKHSYGDVTHWMPLPEPPETE